MVADFMSVMWPSESTSILLLFIRLTYSCPAQRRYYEQLRSDLIQCCVSAGIRVPAVIPIPGLPADVHGTMMISSSLSPSKGASAADILMEPLD